MRHNSGNAVLDKYGFYIFSSNNLKEIEGGKIWICKHNPTKAVYQKKNFTIKKILMYTY